MNLQPTLEDELVRLRPLTAQDYAPLYKLAKDPLVWEQHPNADRWQEPVFKAYFEDGLAAKSAFAIEEKASGELIGWTRYYDFDSATSSVYIGYTFYGRAWWGGRYNPHIKALLLRHAFSSVKFVFLEAGPLNHRSCRAIQKIGGVWVLDYVKGSNDSRVFVLDADGTANRFPIVPAEPADLELIKQLYDEARKAQTARQTIVWPLFSDAMILQDIAEERLFKILVGEEAACVFTITYEDPAIWQELDENDAIYVHRIATNPTHRGPHFVKNMTQWLRARAILQKKDFVRLDTIIKENRRLIDFYQEAGYTYLGASRLPDTISLPPHYSQGDCQLFELKVRE